MAKIIKGNDKNEHTIALFLDLSKAINTLDHDILLKKLELYGIRDTALKLYNSYLKDQTLKVKLKMSSNEGFVYSSEQNINYGTPQGSVLGLLLFVIFTNDIYQHLENADGILFADDTTLYKTGRNENYTRWCIEHDLEILSDWFKANKLTLNLNKTVAMNFGKSRNNTPLQISGQTIPWVEKTKFLGLWLDSDLSWRVHIENLCLHSRCNMYLLCNPRNMLDRSTLRLIYHAHIQSHVSYGLALWGNSVNKMLLNKVSKLLNECIKIIIPRCNTDKSYKILQVLTLNNLIELENWKFSYKVVHGLLPNKIQKICMTDKNNMNLTKQHHYNTRNKNIPNLPIGNKCAYNKSFLVKGLSLLDYHLLSEKQVSNAL